MVLYWVKEINLSFQENAIRKQDNWLYCFWNQEQFFLFWLFSVFFFVIAADIFREMCTKIEIYLWKISSIYARNSIQTVPCCLQQQRKINQHFNNFFILERLFRALHSPTRPHTQQGEVMQFFLVPYSEYAFIFTFKCDSNCLCEFRRKKNN